jgi:TRAP-type C4-dicarboxylate transport system permease small subunit
MSIVTGMSMNRFIDFVETISYRLDRLVGWLCIALGSAMTIVVFVAVVFRYVLNDPFEWSEEASTFMMVWFGMLGASMGVYRGRHVGVSYLIEKIPFFTRHMRLISISANVLMLVFMAVLLWQGALLSGFAARQQSPALMISMFWPYFGLILGAVAVTLQLIFQIVKAAGGRIVYVQDACSYQEEEL